MKKSLIALFLAPLLAFTLTVYSGQNQASGEHPVTAEHTNRIIKDTPRNEQATADRKGGANSVHAHATHTASAIPNDPREDIAQPVPYRHTSTPINFTPIASDIISFINTIEAREAFFDQLNASSYPTPFDREHLNLYFDKHGKPYDPNTLCDAYYYATAGGSVYLLANPFFANHIRQDPFTDIELFDTYVGETNYRVK